MRRGGRRAALALLLPALVCASAAPRRRVNWYLSSANVADNADLIARHGGAISGGYLCCGFGGTLANGTWASQATAEALAQMAPLTTSGREAWLVSSVAEAAVKSGAWASGGAPAGAASALAPLAAAGLAGVIVVYEPADNYTAAHAQAYAEYLGVLAAALAPVGVAVGFDIAGWGILGQVFWPIYLQHAPGLSRFTSMTPTYDATNVTEDRAFVHEAVAAFPAGSYAAGVGSVLDAGSAACEWDYKWNASTFPPFVDFLAGAGVATIDVWRCDIDHHYLPDKTAGWMLDALTRFLAG